MLPSQEARQRFLPLCLHGDAGAFQKNDSIHVISVRSLLSRQNVATAQLLLLALPKGAISKCPGDPSSSTMHHVWSVIKWSFEAAYFNKFPETDHMGKAWPQYSWRPKMAGQPLNSDGHSALLFAIQGDAEYLQNEYGLTLASHESMCFHCGETELIAHSMTSGLVHCGEAQWCLMLAHVPLSTWCQGSQV